MSLGREDLDSDDEPDLVKLRVRLYQEGPGKEWVVFFRPKRKPLNAMRISEDLLKRYPGVTNVTKLHRNKIRVTTSNPKEANEIVVDPRFCIEYRVWIPARSVEIDGVVSENGLTVEQVLKGVGQFRRRNLPTVQIVEARQMGTSEGGRFVPSNSFRVTFAGTALPDYLVIDDMLRLPVRLYRPRVMSCTNCKKLGHTATCCSNKTVCGRCGDKHPDGQCEKPVEKCLLCGCAPHDTRTCIKYKERSHKLHQDLKKRSKQSFAEIVKSAAAATTKDENPYDVLSQDDADIGKESSGEELIFYSKTGAPKRKKIWNAPRNPKKSELPASEEINQAFPLASSKRTSISSKDRTQNRTTLEDDAQKQEQLKDIRLPFSLLFDMIMSLVSDPIKAILEPLIPLFKQLGKILIEKSPLVDVILFDI